MTRSENGSSRKRYVAIVAAAALSVGMLSGSALGSHDGNTIHACKKLNSGALRAVDGPDGCLPSEEAVEWNIVGPQGVPGPQGEQGPSGPQGEKGDTGAQGEKGDPGIIGFNRISRSYVAADGETVTTVDHPCISAGDTAVGGGFRVNDTRANVVESRPLSNGWRVAVAWGDSVRRDFVVHVVCAALA